MFKHEFSWFFSNVKGCIVTYYYRIFHPSTFTCQFLPNIFSKPNVNLWIYWARACLHSFNSSAWHWNNKAHRPCIMIYRNDCRTSSRAQIIELTISQTYMELIYINKSASFCSKKYWTNADSKNSLFRSTLSILFW